MKKKKRRKSLNTEADKESQLSSIKQNNKEISQIYNFLFVLENMVLFP